MRFETSTKLLLFLLFHLIFSESGYAQDINVNLNTIDSLTISNTDNLMFDVNGEICSMVIMTTDLNGLKFYSNLGVEKIIKIENGYKIWLPNQANVLKFIIPGYSLFEYDLPHSAFKYSVYIISLQVEKYEKTIIKDTLQSSLSIATSPAKAKIYLNGWYVGKSPKIIKNPVNFLKFEYSLKKKGFGTYSSNDSMDRKVKNISVELIDLSRTRRYFLLFNIKWDGLSRSQVDAHGMPGITFGVFGKTGMYGSINVLFVNGNKVITRNFRSIPDYYNYNKGQKLSLSAGITQQLGKSIFIYGGPNYVKRSYQREGYLDGKSESVNLNTGIVFRIGWYSLLQIDYCPGINNSFSSIGLGLGLNFSKKIKTPNYSTSIIK